ncbi:MFS transporter [Serratia microhaemolytica]|uniref:MFS transporter n=1 Tax=Serratia microhaemolytica TaxID=2675110 RepID=UPI000FDDF50F|nr:MFS transporter [Serratia microhaemolytica]
MNDNTMTRQELRTTWGLGLVFSLRMLGMFMVLPVLTTYGMALQGANETLIGIAIGIYGLMQALFQIPLGLISDRIGRKPLIISGLFIFALGSIIAALSQSIWGIILGRALQGAGAIAAVLMALLADLTREQHRTKAMAFIGVSFGITFAIAMVLGPIITNAFGLKTLFWMIAVFACGGILLILLVVPTPKNPILNRETSMVRGSFGKVLSNTRLLRLNFSIMCLHILLMANFVALPWLLEHAGLATSQHWKIYLVTMLIAFACVVPAIIYAEKQRKMKQVMMFCVAMLLCAELLLALSGVQLPLIIAGVLLFFVAFNILEAILPSLISKESPAGYKGTALGVYSTCQFAGVAIGASVGGWLYGSQGTMTMFLIGALVVSSWFIIVSTMQHPPYVSSLRIDLSARTRHETHLTERIMALAGVTEVVIVASEAAAYIKVDTQQTSRHQLEQILQ